VATTVTGPPNPLLETASAAARIPGTVIFARQGDQTVLPRYYTNLGVGGSGIKTFGPATGPDYIHYAVAGEFIRYGSVTDYTHAIPLTHAQAGAKHGIADYSASVTDLNITGVSN
jgi:hypothetical protein